MNARNMRSVATNYFPARFRYAALDKQESLALDILVISSSGLTQPARGKTKASERQNMATGKRKSGKPRERAVCTVKVEFSNEEWKSRSDVLTRKMKEQELAEEQVKADAAAAKARIKGMKAEVNDLANNLRNGYEMVEVEAWVELDRKKGKKRFYRNAPGKPHNNDFIREDPMSEDDYASLPLEADAKALPNAVLPEGSEAATAAEDVAQRSPVTEDDLN